MIDINLVRDNYDVVLENIKNRGYDEKILSSLREVDKKWRFIKKQLDSLRRKRNDLISTIKLLKKENKDISSTVEESRVISKEIKEKEKEEKELLNKRNNLLARIPNILHESVPIGKDENNNKVYEQWGEIKKKNAKPHYVLGIEQHVLDFERGAKLGGHRFTVMSDWASKLERALINFMLDVHTSKGYKEFWLPHLVKEKIMFGSGQLPKFREEVYKTQLDNLYLIPTAEVSLVNLHNGEILNENELPKHYCAYTPSYRREAGAYGKDIKGMIRQHQFDKVELVKFTLPEDSWREFEAMLKDVQDILRLLELPYQLTLLCSGDTGFTAAKTVDVEVWLPSQNRFREISSVSNCTDFQARRANIRVRRKHGLEYVHTLNGSGLAVGRTLIAIMENFQEDNGLRIPSVLIDYMHTDYIHFD